jgi:hypothetical protein
MNRKTNKVFDIKKTLISEGMKDSVLKEIHIMQKLKSNFVANS